MFLKKLIIIFFILVSNQTAWSQVPLEDATFLEKIIREKKSSGEIVYTNHLSGPDGVMILHKLKSPQIHSAESESNFIELSRNERKQLEMQIKELVQPFWNRNLFRSCQMIEHVNVQAYFKSVYNHYSETLSNPNNSQLDKSNLLKETPQPFVFEFTPPLYLRNKTVCLLFMKTVCGVNCSSSELTFFKKENDKWVKWVSVGMD